MKIFKNKYNQDVVKVQITIDIVVGENYDEEDVLTFIKNETRKDIGETTQEAVWDGNVKIIKE